MPEEPEEAPENATPAEEESAPEWTDDSAEIAEAADAEEYAEPAEEESPLEEEAAPEPSQAVVETGETATEGLLQPCPNCATLLDVGELEPFAKVHCPICGTSMRARTQLRNFTLVEVLGAGGMGAVYRALDTNLNRMVALKVVRKEYSSDAEYLAKFEREARITASVNHPHVVKVYSFGSDHGLFYIAMELVDKGSLDDLMSLQRRVAEVQALQVGIQIAQGLNAALQRGLIHRDVKPGNILFSDAQTAKIVDFGLALLAEHAAEERGEVWGTPYYVAPEKLDHQPEDFRSDLYSLGGTLFHAIAGRPPFEAETASMVALKHLKSQAVSLQAFAPDVSNATAYVINRMLHKDPDQRYQSYEELVEHLEYARTQLTQQTAGGPRRPRERVVVGGAKQQKISGILSLAMLAVLLALGFAGYKYRNLIFNRQEQPGLATDDGQTAQHMHDRFDAARKQLVGGDFAGAQAALQKIVDDDNGALTQPLQNWITLNQGLASLLRENTGDARGWFKVVVQYSHFSTDPSDSALVDFFSRVGDKLSDERPIPPSAGEGANDGAQAMAPLLYALKDWTMEQFDDADRLFKTYLAANPKAPFDWIADYKPLARKYDDLYTGYQAATAAAAAADTPDKRADAIKQVEALEPQAKGKMAEKLRHLKDGLKQKSADLDSIYNQHVAEEKARDDAATRDLDRQFNALCADFAFDRARTMAAEAIATTPGASKEKGLLQRKADWLLQFKATLVRDVNAYGYAGALTTRAGAALPEGTKTADDAALHIKTSFGEMAVPWNTLPASAVLAIANSYAQANLPADQAADRQWLAGVFACVEGMAREGRPLLVQASQVKDEYKNELGIFVESE